MIKHILDLRTINGRDELYDRITASFRFPGYFGRNLDALYDCLTEIAEDTCVAVLMPDAGKPFPEHADDGLQELQALDGITKSFVPSSLTENADLHSDFSDYLKKLRATFEDAEEANAHLCVLVIE